MHQRHCPRLMAKVSIRKPIRRLSGFRRLFLASPELFETDECWLCREPLVSDDMSLDHVVPHRYLYSDDLWNLVPVHRVCNSRKGSRVAPPEVLQRVSRRNAAVWEFAETRTDLRRWSRAVAQDEGDFQSRLPNAASGAVKAGFRVYPRSSALSE